MDTEFLKNIEQLIWLLQDKNKMWVTVDKYSIFSNNVEIQ